MKNKRKAVLTHKSGAVSTIVFKSYDSESKSDFKSSSSREDIYFYTMSDEEWESMMMSIWAEDIDN